MYALVDCGSDDTILPLYVGNFIGAKVDHAQTWLVSGIGGKGLELVLGEIEFELRHAGRVLRWPARIGFAPFETALDEVALLGHAGFLDFFTTTLDGNNHAVELIPNATFRGRTS